MSTAAPTPAFDGTGPAPEVSFVVPLFNGLALTQAMVASLQATLPRGLAHEVILVDDGSTDGTRAWLQTLSAPFRVVLNERNLGYAISNNRAAALARGERLVLLNNDLVLLPGWFDGLIAAHLALGRRAGLVGNVQLTASTGAVDHVGIGFDLKAKPEHDRCPPSRWSRWFRAVRPVPAVTAACVMIDAALWRALGGFDEGFVNGGEDVDLCFRASAHGRINAVALRSVIRHHVSASPGRKLRDEANSERLARRWRAEFVAAATPGWCRERLGDVLSDPRGYPPRYALQLVLGSLGWVRHAPPEAGSALNRALDLEFVRWRALARKRPPTG